MSSGISQALIGPEYVERAINLFENATTSIFLVVFDWRWYPSAPAGPSGRFNSALRDAVARGVSVRAIVNNDDIKGRLESIGVQVRRTHMRRLLHAKLVIVDAAHALVGSHNFTQQAFSHNVEVSMHVSGEAYDPKLEQFFNTLWSL